MPIRHKKAVAVSLIVCLAVAVPAYAAYHYAVRVLVSLSMRLSPTVARIATDVQKTRIWKAADAVYSAYRAGKMAHSAYQFTAHMKDIWDDYGSSSGEAFAEHLQSCNICEESFSEIFAATDLQAPKRVPCTHKVACGHMGPCLHISERVKSIPCQHTIPCQHPVACVHKIACGHVFMTPWGLRTHHPFHTLHSADALHPYGDRLHAYDPMSTYVAEHPQGHSLHSHHYKHPNGDTVLY